MCPGAILNPPRKVRLAPACSCDGCVFGSEVRVARIQIQTVTHTHSICFIFNKAPSGIPLLSFYFRRRFWSVLNTFRHNAGAWRMEAWEQYRTLNDGSHRTYWTRPTNTPQRHVIKVSTHLREQQRVWCCPFRCTRAQPFKRSETACSAKKVLSTSVSSDLHPEQGLPLLQEHQRLSGIDCQRLIEVMDSFPAPPPKSQPCTTPETTRRTTVQ